MSKPESDIAARQTEAQRRAAPVMPIHVSTYRQDAPKAAQSYGGSGVTGVENVQRAIDARLEQTRNPGGEYRR
jgi:hypothetical protein